MQEKPPDRAGRPWRHPRPQPKSKAVVSPAPEITRANGVRQPPAEKICRHRQAPRQLDPRPVDLEPVRAAVRILRLQMPIPLDANDFLTALAINNPRAFWKLVDALAFEVLVERFRLDKHKTDREKNRRLKELMVNWLAAEGIV